MIPLDLAGLHGLDERGGELVFEGRIEAVARAVRVGGRPLDPITGAAPRGRVTLALEDGSEVEGHRLCPFELRYAADHGRLHAVPRAARAATVTTPITDLHTHYAACLSGPDLVALGRTHGIVYPPALLAEAGIRVDRPTAVKDLPQDVLARALAVPLDRRITFLDMERLYRLRAPITRALVVMPAYLRKLAEDYAAMGVRYVELSLGSILEARVLRLVHEHVPSIEAETGVTLRFLAALSRHDDPEWDEDALARLEAIAGSDYIAGLDIMGHETNSTRAFVPQLVRAARIRPGFVIRVHAGESPSHPENVRIAIEAVRGADVSLRIGHGLYGVDDETLELLVASRAVVEMNLDSNVALNHLSSGRVVPLRRYADAGVRLVLGTDGYGLYGASAESSARAALLCGLRAADLDAMRALEASLVPRAPAKRSFVVPDDPPPVAFTEAVIARRRAAEAARAAALRAALAVPLVSADVLARSCEGRLVVSVAGAWNQSWAAMSEHERAWLAREIDAFVDALDPSTVLLTGGTGLGVEGRVARRAQGRRVIGGITAETPPEHLDAMTEAVLLAPSLYEKGARLYELVRTLRGGCVFFGGGQIVKDEIQAAKNLGLPYVVMAGPGASGEHARLRPDRAVTTGAEAAAFVRGLAERQGRVMPHWYEGVNPTVDAVVVRDGREVLLVRRSVDAPVEAGAWALPGGFVRTDAPRGGPWLPGRETEEEACLRELREETALVATQLRRVGVFEGGGRDPRDGPRSFSRTTVFRVDLAGETRAIAGGDDADDARWFSLDALPARLAFDHAAILAFTLRSDP